LKEKKEKRKEKRKEKHTFSKESKRSGGELLEI
jgi:hypothetical protein